MLMFFALFFLLTEEQLAAWEAQREREAEEALRRQKATLRGKSRHVFFPLGE